MRILVVDDEKNIRESIARFLRLDGMEPVIAENGLSAQRLLEEQTFAAGIIDLKMPGMDGLELLRWIQSEGPRLPVIMISAYGEINDAVEAMKLGAQDYVVKPFDPEELVLRLKKIIQNRRLQDQVTLGARREAWELIGESAPMRRIRQMVDRIAATPSTVLITGESGTGKEVIARAIHARSDRASGPFVPVNVGGIPDTLLESELFGYERGAFTGADRRKEGMFELASGGTLFLDEIGEMPPHLQVKLLRVLQDHKVQRLGGTHVLPVDVRVVAATNQDLEARVGEGRFREDLFYRLNVIRIEVPPLRERPEDVPLLAGHVIARLNKKLGREIAGIDSEALRALAEHIFPGNVRELENLIERAFIFAEGDTITAKELSLPQSSAPARPRPATLDSMERQAVIEALHRWEGNRTRAAAELGITRRTLLNKIKEYGLEEL